MQFSSVSLLVSNIVSIISLSLPRPPPHLLHIPVHHADDGFRWRSGSHKRNPWLSLQWDTLVPGCSISPLHPHPPPIGSFHSPRGSFAFYLAPLPWFFFPFSSTDAMRGFAWFRRVVLRHRPRLTRLKSGPVLLENGAASLRAPYTRALGARIDSKRSDDGQLFERPSSNQPPSDPLVGRSSSMNHARFIPSTLAAFHPPSLSHTACLRSYPGLDASRPEISGSKSAAETSKAKGKRDRRGREEANVLRERGRGDGERRII